MTDAVPATVVLAYLATLSLDLRAAAVLDATGGILAGDPGAAAATAALVAGAEAGRAHRVPHVDGSLYAARSGTHAVGLVVGPHALEAVVVHDLLATLDDLRGC